MLEWCDVVVDVVLLNRWFMFKEELFVECVELLLFGVEIGVVKVVVLKCIVCVMCCSICSVLFVLLLLVVVSVCVVNIGWM